MHSYWASSISKPWQMIRPQTQQRPACAWLLLTWNNQWAVLEAGAFSFLPGKVWRQPVPLPHFVSVALTGTTTPRWQTPGLSAFSLSGGHAPPQCPGLFRCASYGPLSISQPPSVKRTTCHLMFCLELGSSHPTDAVHPQILSCLPSPRHDNLLSADTWICNLGRPESWHSN